MNAKIVVSAGKAYPLYHDKIQGTVCTKKIIMTDKQVFPNIKLQGKDAYRLE